MSDSLLASASVVPRSSAASVGARPTEPVMPFSTTSASTSRTSCTASSMPTAVYSTAELRRLRLEQRAVRAGGEPDDLEAPRVGADDVERLGADRTG